MLEEIVGSRYAVVGTAEDDDFLWGCWSGVLRHLHAKIKIDRGYYSGIKRLEKPRRCRKGIAWTGRFVVVKRGQGEAKIRR